MLKRKMAAAACAAAMLVIGGIPAGAIQPASVQAAITDGNVLVEGLDRSPNYYILPNSSIEEISAREAASLSDSERQMAINEIYARYGRMFEISQVQDYFNEKSWYFGTVAAEDFDVNVFNEIEENNIETLRREIHYILPGSDLRYISDTEAASLSAEDLQLAINEIYARRGRKFDMQEYRDYFNSQSWYYGYIEPSAFNESIFNEYETANLNKLIAIRDGGSTTSSSGSSGSCTTLEYYNFSGEYRLYPEGKEVIMEIRLYSDKNTLGAASGTDCGTVKFTVNYNSGGTGTLSGNLLKVSGNNYKLSGKGVNGITLNVQENYITVGNSKSINGNYEKTRNY